MGQRDKAVENIRALWVWMTLATLFIGLFMGGTAEAQENSPSPLPLLQGRPDETNDAALTGPMFDDPMQGIALRPPVDAETIRQNLAPDDIVQFINKDAGWVLKVSRAQLSKSIPLASALTLSGAAPGLLDLTAQKFKATNPSAVILHQQIDRLPGGDCGILIARYAQSHQPRLMQQAIFHVDDQVYYVLTMTSPATPGDQADVPQSDQQHALHIFAAVMQSVQLIDRTKIKEDQNQRLLRTRAFYGALTPEKIRKALDAQAVQRISQNGKDIGYRYIVEEPEKRFGHDGIRVGIRGHIESAGGQVDSESWLTCAFDRKDEEWSTAVMTVNSKGQKSAVSELGTSTQYSREIFDPLHGVADPSDPGQPRVRTENHYELRVTRLSAGGTNQPIERNLPPFYVPQALGYLLPALLAKQAPQTYMFAVWSDEQQQVVTRYLDVRPAQSVELGGKMVQVIAVEDRLGLEGSVTIHYVTPAGREIATRAEGVLSCDTDSATLLSIWKNANLTPPG